MRRAEEKIHTVCQFIYVQHVERMKALRYSGSDEGAPNVDQREGGQEVPHRAHVHATRRAVGSARAAPITSFLSSQKVTPSPKKPCARYRRGRNNAKSVGTIH